MSNSRSRRQDLRPNSIEHQRRTVLGFRYEGGVYIGLNERGLFKPRGLLIWGPTDTAVISAAVIGMEEQVLQSIDAVPAKFFALGLSFEHVSKLVEEEGVEPPTWCDWNTLGPGCSVRIIVLDDARALLGPQHGIKMAMWGTNSVRIEMAIDRHAAQPPVEK